MYTIYYITKVAEPLLYNCSFYIKDMDEFKSYG